MFSSLTRRFTDRRNRSDEAIEPARTCSHTKMIKSDGSETDSDPQGQQTSEETTKEMNPPRPLEENQEGFKDENRPSEYAEKGQYKIIVIGKTGTGKSSLCNKIIRTKKFCTGRAFKSVTTEHQEEKTVYRDLHITVEDTQDISGESKTTRKKIVDMWKKSAEEYNYMVVLAVRCDTRYSPADYEVYAQIKQLWGHDLVKRLVVAFTFGDTREDPGLDMKKELEEVWPELKHVIKDANNRYVVFNNEHGSKVEEPVEVLIEYMQQFEPMKEETVLGKLKRATCSLFGGKPNK